jgi:hypothetical protein
MQQPFQNDLSGGAELSAGQYRALEQSDLGRAPPEIDDVPHVRHLVPLPSSFFSSCFLCLPLITRIAMTKMIQTLIVIVSVAMSTAICMAALPRPKNDTAESAARCSGLKDGTSVVRYSRKDAQNGSSTSISAKPIKLEVRQDVGNSHWLSYVQGEREKEGMKPTDLADTKCNCGKSRTSYPHWPPSSTGLPPRLILPAQRTPRTLLADIPLSKTDTGRDRRGVVLPWVRHRNTEALIFCV